MMNLPQSFFSDPKQGDGSSANGGASANDGAIVNAATGATANGAGVIGWESASVDQLLHLLGKQEHREKAISFLTQIKKQGSYKDLAIKIWHSPNTVFILLLEVTSVYRLLTPGKLTMKESSRICDVLALFECLATHRETKMDFLNARIHSYLYPFLTTVETERPFQYLRLMSLAVIGGLLREISDPMAKVTLHCLLESGFFPLCLRSIDFGNELSQSTASWIISRILMQDLGLHYCCEPLTRLCAIMRVFKGVIEKMHDNPSPSVLKNIIQCYLVLSSAPRACLLIKSFIPQILTSPPYINTLRERPIALKNLKELFRRLATGHGSNGEPVGDTVGSLELDR